MYHKRLLPNGITLITVPVAGTRATTILAMFPIGSRYETKKLSGASHFLEHMLFKGTEQRPESTDISRILEAAGAEFNAYTNKDYTGYYVKIDGAKQELAFDLLSDMIYHSKIDEAEVAKEKGAIVEELRMYKDNPTMAVDMLFDAALFGEHPLGWDIGGSEQSVRGITREELWNYYRQHYGPKNMVLVVAGRIDRKLKKYLNYFSRQKASTTASDPKFYARRFLRFNFSTAVPALAVRVRVEKRKADQAHLILGWPGLPNNHPDRYAASVLLTILGGGMSSRLFVEVREKRGLAYMVHAGSSSFRDTGAVYVQAGLDPARLAEAIQVIMAECVRMGAEPVTARELADAKSQITGGLALSLENSKTQAEWYAKQFLFNTKIETPEQVVAKVQKVTARAIQKTAARLFKSNQARAALIGAVKKDAVIKMFA